MLRENLENHRNSSNKFYLMNYGWANRYIWFDSVEDAYFGMPHLIDLVINKQITLKKKTGTTFADAHGSTHVEGLFSQNVIDILSNQCKNQTKAYEVRFVPELKPPCKYYCINIINTIKGIRTKEVKQYMKKKGVEKDNIIVIGDDCSGDLTSWNGSGIFSVEGSRYKIVTKHLKSILEKAKLKNVKFEEVEKLS